MKIETILQPKKKVPPVRRENKSIDARKADKNIKYCIKCKKCWELDWLNYSRNRLDLYSYYSNFPSYGKIKEICNKCKEE